jgi:hypothetical protein
MEKGRFSRSGTTGNTHRAAGLELEIEAIEHRARVSRQANRKICHLEPRAPVAVPARIEFHHESVTGRIDDVNEG